MKNPTSRHCKIAGKIDYEMAFADCSAIIKIDIICRMFISIQQFYKVYSNNSVLMLFFSVF